MSGGFNNPLVGGGGSLVYPSIHSPNFVTGVSGWSINKNGSAEFNNLTVRNGTFISGVFLMYGSAIPAKGNLVVAFAPITGGTDAVGNVYPRGFNFGIWDATGALKSHFGIDQNGNVYCADTTGATRISIDPAIAAQVFYDTSGLSVGHMVQSIASAAGTDLAGNNVQAGFTSYDNTFGGVAQLISAGLSLFSGVVLRATLSPNGLSIFNSHGALVFSIDVTRDAWFHYADTGTATQGGLISSSASAAGTDSFGNASQGGITNYAPSSKLSANLLASVLTLTSAATGTQIVSGAFVALLDAFGVGDRPALRLFSPTTSANQSASLHLFGESSNVVNPSQAVFTKAGLISGGLTSALLEAQGSINATGIASGDTTTYQSSGRATQIVTPTPQTINNVGGQGVNGISFPVAVGIVYEFEALLFCTAGANNVLAAAAVTGPATSFASFEIEGTDTTHGSTVSSLGGGNQTVMGTLTNFVNTATISNTHTFTIKIRGRFVATATGSVGIKLNTSVAANTYTVNNGSYATMITSI